MAKVTFDHFTGSGKVFGQGNDHLAAIIRGMAQDIATLKVATVTDLTDSSTGTANTANYALEAQNVTLTAHTVSGSSAVAKSTFDTALGKIANAQATLAAQLTAIKAVLGSDIPALTDSTGGSSGAGTIGAMDKSLAGASSSLVDGPTGRARLTTIRANTAVLARAVNRVVSAAGFPEVSQTLLGEYALTDANVLAAITATGTAVNGASGSTLAKTEVDAALTAIANNVATLAAKLNTATGAARAGVSVVAWTR